jgi:hypothetical protein
MKKLLFLLVSGVGLLSAQSYTVSVGSGINAYATPSNFGYMSFSTPVAENSYSITTVEMYGNVARLRTGLAHDLATTGPATLFALADLGVATNGNGNVGVDFSTGSGIRVRGNGVPFVNRWVKTDKAGFLWTTLLHKSAISNPDGTTGVQPSFTAGVYLTFGK